MANKSTFTLSNGVEFPLIGYGTSPSSEHSHEALVYAIDSAGYRLIDTARYYGTEKLVAEDIGNAKVDRKELFLTTKIWPVDYGYEKTSLAIQNSLENLQTTYIDMILLHWPIVNQECGDTAIILSQSWKALEEAYNAGICKAIGVSNFKQDHLEMILSSASVKPMLNQVEYHPFCFNQPLRDLQSFCNQHSIKLQGYCLLLRGKIADQAISEPLTLIGNKYGKSAAQVVIRWCLHHDVAVLVKSSNFQRLVQFRDVFDFQLSKEDIEQLDGLSKSNYIKIIAPADKFPENKMFIFKEETYEPRMKLD